MFGWSEEDNRTFEILGSLSYEDVYDLGALSEAKKGLPKRS